MRSVLGITKSVDILDHIYSLDIAEQEIANEKVRQVERNAMVQMVRFFIFFVIFQGDH